MTNPVMVVRKWVKQTDGVTTAHGRGCWVFCPGCLMSHVFDVMGEDGTRPENKAVWEWDGNMERPTFSPSMLVHTAVHLCPADYVHFQACPNPDICGEHGHAILDVQTLKPAEMNQESGTVLGHPLPHAVDPAWGPCHSFLRAGRWEFLGDSAHALAGQSVDMVPLPDWLVLD